MPPLVSIIMPVRNGSPYLERAIRSILSQTLQDFELLVVDDASSDDTPHVLMALSAKDKRIRTITLPLPSGICGALNTGLEVVSGHYIARMDADDLARPERLAIQVSYLQAHPDLALCGSRVRRFGEGVKPFVFRGPSNPAIIRAALVFDNPLFHASVMIRGDFLRQERWRYDERYRHAEDYDLWSRIAKNYSLGQVPQVLLDYRVHAGNVTNTSTSGMNAAAQMIMDRHLREMGIEATDEELCFHRSMTAHRLLGGYTRETMARVRDWLSQLTAANINTGKHPPGAFASTADQVWFICCYDALPSLPGIPVLYLKGLPDDAPFATVSLHATVLVAAQSRLWSDGKVVR
jgi:glycosyltransferase involved in cell wall biosynthesis